MTGKSGNHFWYYVDEVHDGPPKIKGPFSEAQILRAARSGALRPDTRIRSPSLTNNKWVFADTVGQLAELIQLAEADDSDPMQRKKDGL